MFPSRFLMAFLPLRKIPTTTVRILLNHFKWDKEKLMEKFFSDEQDEMFAEAKVISPFKKSNSKGTKETCQGPTKSSRSSPPTSDCEICCLTLPKSVIMMHRGYFTKSVSQFF